MNKLLLFLLPLGMLLFTDTAMAQFSQGFPVISVDIVADEHHRLDNLLTVSGDLDPELELMLAIVTDSLRNHYGMKSLSTSVILPDHTYFIGAAGQSSAILPATPNHSYGMGSITKTFTAAAILRLHETGLLSLSDTLGIWFTQLPNVAGHITIEQLLNHTSGIANVTENSAFYVALNANLDSVWNPYAVVEQFTLQPLFTPGSSWYYSNTNYVLAGLIIESVTGLPFHEAVKELVIDPLDLPSIKLAAYEVLGNPVANVWGDPGNGMLLDFTALGISLTSLYSMAWASGAMFATPYELSIWMKALFEGEFLSIASLELMKNTITLTPQLKYGLGIMQQDVYGHQGFGHNGYIYYGSSSLYFPEKGLTITLMTNDGSFNASAWPDLTYAYIKAYEQWIDGVTTVSEVRVNFATLVYPNPATDYFCIQADEELQWISIYNVAGQLVYRHASGNKERHHCVDTANLPAGVYHINVQGTLGMSNTRLVVR